jgi:hypothetical protein
MTYKVIESFDGIKTIQRTNPDGSLTFIPFDEANADYAEYLNPSEAKTI